MAILFEIKVTRLPHDRSIITNTLHLGINVLVLSYFLTLFYKENHSLAQCDDNNMLWWMKITVAKLVQAFAWVIEVQNITYNRYFCKRWENFHRILSHLISTRILPRCCSNIPIRRRTIPLDWELMDFSLAR